jgi:hypothetical protein
MSYKILLMALARYALHLDRKYGRPQIMMNSSGDITLVVENFDDFTIKSVASLGNSIEKAVERLNVMIENIKVNKARREAENT